MQDPRMLPPEEASNPKSRKKKPTTQKASRVKVQQDYGKAGQEPPRPLPIPPGQKGSKRGLKNEVSPMFQQPEKSTSDSMPDSSNSGNEYRTLRRKYLMLEEESFGLGGELREVEEEVMGLEKEKHKLLDELVVLEGLIDPSEVQAQNHLIP